MKRLSILFTAVFLMLSGLVWAAEQAVLVHNTLHDIDARRGKLKLNLVRVWGGDDEEDDNKFFKYPSDVAVGKNDRVYISDSIAHCVKVFKSNGEYVRTIGRRGKGPGDLYGPHAIAISPAGDLLVYEMSGRRLQCFDPQGKSKKILKRNAILWWMAVTSKGEWAVYDKKRTFTTKKLVAFLNGKGKVVKEIGTLHGTYRSSRETETLRFAMDDGDNIYTANTRSPAIRKYSPSGALLTVITYEFPFETAPVKIMLNDNGDEIKRIEPGDSRKTSKVTRKGGGMIIQKIKRKGKPKIGAWRIATDSRRRVYAVMNKRLLTEKEMMAGRISGNSNVIDRSLVDYDIVENIDHLRLLVFSPEGKVIAEAQLTTVCDGMNISGNRIFIVDGGLNQRILEYRMKFAE